MGGNETWPELCFADTNVWLYAFIEGQQVEKSTAAKSLLQEKQLIVSTQVVNEVCVNLIR